jgi:pyruvate kinase
MVARGDLGIELPLEEIPLFQKSIIARANILGKPTIVATQMLMSMVNHFFPTRAEVSDVANAVLDGTSGLMLSDETAFGSYPIESLQYLVRIIERTERFQFGQPLLK